MFSYIVQGRFLREYSPLRGFPGMTLRGAFGYALRSVACTEGRSDCRSCPRYRDCVYARMFESSSYMAPSIDVAAKSGKEGVTNPYTIELLYLKNGKLAYRINVFGEAVEWEGPILVAIVGMGVEGLGIDKALGERRKFEVTRVDRAVPPDWERHTVYEPGSGYIYHRATPPRSLLECFERRALELVELRPRRLLVRFTTPFRVVEGGKPTYTPSLAALVMNIARKYSMLAAYHRAGRPLTRVEARDVKAAAQRARLVWFRVYSEMSARKRSIEGGQKSFGGFARAVLVYAVDRGVWRLDGAITMLKLLLLGEYLHVGKLASAGYGDYELYFSF